MALEKIPTSEKLVERIINASPEDFEYKVWDEEFASVNFTNFCSNACYYCTCSRDNWDLKRWRLSQEEIVDAFREPYESGKRNFLLYGGVDLFFGTEKLVALVRKIKEVYPDCELYTAFGEKVYEDYQAIKDAGADGFLLFHRSADEEHFSKIHPIDLYPDFRKKVLLILREMGFKIGTGITVGWPDQTAEILAKDIAFVAELKPELLVIDAFLPQEHTVYENHGRGDKKQTENVRGIVAELLPDTKLLTKL